MRRTLQLKEHYEKWKTVHFASETFYEDGIIDEKQYNDLKYKILFIAKEPNGKNHEHIPSKSFCDEWRQETPKYGFADRIAEWAAGILNNFPEFDDVDKMDRNEYRGKIAFMNVKKKAGTGNTENLKEFNDYVYTQIELLRKQVKLIEPEIIILSLSHNNYLRNLIFPETEWESSGYQIKVARRNDYKIIDFYHPSSRIVAVAAYCMLKNVMESKVFKDL